VAIAVPEAVALARQIHCNFHTVPSKKKRVAVGWFVMDKNQPAKKPRAAVPGTRRKVERESPFVRFGFFAVFVLTLPFTWGQTSSCNGPGKAYTGFELVTKSPEESIALGILFIAPVLLGFVQYYRRPNWMHVVMELVAAICSGLGTAYCFLAAVFSNLFSNKGGPIFPAPFIATLAAFLMTLHALKGIVIRIAELVTTRKKKGNRGD
jgi:hypothetical protein